MKRPTFRPTYEVKIGQLWVKVQNAEIGPSGSLHYTLKTIAYDALPGSWRTVLVDVDRKAGNI